MTTLAAAGTFWLAYDGGTYDLASRTTAAIVVLWALVVGVGAGFLPRTRVPVATLLTGAFLAAFGGFTLASAAWASSAEGAYSEFARVVLYLAVFVLAGIGGSRVTAAGWSDGLGLGVAAIGILAVASRLFPGLVSAADLETLLPETHVRLSYPLDYWNGLAIFIALAFPLLLRSAVEWPRPLRAIALAPLPALAGAIYLTSSRGGAAVALLGTVVFVVTAGRWAVAGAAALATAGSAVAVAALHHWPAVVNPSGRELMAAGEGHRAALALLVVCAATSGAYALADWLLVGRTAPSRTTAVALAAACGVAAIAVVSFSHPGRRFETFKAPPPRPSASTTGFVESHLLSSNGSGRWQFWSAAVREFDARPLDGRGAGSYEAWWAQHGTLQDFVRDAHSLYVEQLGELGIVGFALLVLALASGAAVGAYRLAALPAARRPTVAALLACFLAYCLGAGIDWMWELTAVSVVGMACLGLLTGAATAGESGRTGSDPVRNSRRPAAPRRGRTGSDPVRNLTRPPAPGSGSDPVRTTTPLEAGSDPVRTRRPERPRPGRLRPGRRTRIAARAAFALVALALVVAEAMPLLSSTKVDESQAAARRGDSAAARSDALAAHNLEPWAATPYLQLALVQEQAGSLRAARDSILEAISRDRLDWRLWLVRARVETKAGEIRAARRSLARARALNPRSPLFAKKGAGA